MYLSSNKFYFIAVVVLFPFQQFFFTFFLFSYLFFYLNSILFCPTSPTLAQHLQRRTHLLVVYLSTYLFGWRWRRFTSSAANGINISYPMRCTMLNSIHTYMKGYIDSSGSIHIHAIYPYILKWIEIKCTYVFK